VGVAAQEPSLATVASVKPNFLPPSELMSLLGLSPSSQGDKFEWTINGDTHQVVVRHNDPSNLILLLGTSADVAAAEDLIRAADVAPRQIVIEARIIDIDDSKTRGLGLDWDALLSQGLPRVSFSARDSDREDKRHTKTTNSTIETPPGNTVPYTRTYTTRDHTDQDTYSQDLNLSSNVDFSRVLQLLDETGALTTRHAPRILTLNNKRANILSGSRVTYVTRYSSYSNFWVTDSMDAGLTLDVLPSLGESGYLTLQIRAELTRLQGDISGSPVKVGQMVENTVVVKNGETVFLGGFDRTEHSVVIKRFPLLGHVIPFLFSHESTRDNLVRSIVALTPRIVDFDTRVDSEMFDSLGTGHLKE
jgi:type IV pilus assembly protein PilQ